MIAYESRLLRMLEAPQLEEDETTKIEASAALYTTYARLGHIHLLALDYAKGLQFRVFYMKNLIV